MTDHPPIQTTIKPKKKKYFLLAFLLIFVLPLVVMFSLIIALIWINPSATSFTLREDWDTLKKDRYSLRTYWVPYDKIPESMKWAAVAAEDQLFWEHQGFDIESIREAWDERQGGIRSRGASTISQQVVKNLFLSSSTSFFRKGIEAGITVFVELFWTKDRILEMYLNIAEFGPGIFGIGRAADVYWNIPATKLNADRSARLAAVLPSPKRMRVEPPSPYTITRSRWILRQINQLTGKSYVRPAPNNPTVVDSLSTPDNLDTLTTPDTIDSTQQFMDVDLDELLNTEIDTIPSQ
ncbi:MAG TPA: monofunctional biosynthetic peptidoglycan transglycosylase [Bacteroidetes bacterium]|nr:monofunctional biosynthetic peptidoglycan transglycosylase [Bacteroidota bacterium]